jgi:hypothetical protein
MYSVFLRGLLVCLPIQLLQVSRPIFDGPNGKGKKKISSGLCLYLLPWNDWDADA